MNKKTFLNTPRLLLGVVAILSASSFLLFARREPKIELNPYQALGMVAVQYTGLATLGGWLPEQLSPSKLADHIVDDLAEVPGALGF